MADLDTANKRASAIGIARITHSLGPVPDGAFNQADRQELAYTYPGILAAILTAPAFFGDLTTLFVHYCEDLRDAATLAQRDLPVLVRNDLPTVVATTNSKDDRNTTYAEYLS